MKEKCKKYSVLAVLLSVWTPLFIGYLYYDGLAEVDQLSPSLIFENPDQENLVADQQSKGKIIVTGLESFGSPERSDFSEPFLPFSPRTISLAHLRIPLRC